MPQKKSMFSDSFRRRSSFTFASVPAFSSALRSSIFRLPRSPPAALISSAASCWPLNIGSPSTAAGPVKKVIWPILNGLPGMFPFGLCCAWATPTTFRGLGAAVRARPGATLAVLVSVFALHVFLPPLLLAVTRKPWTYFTFNPWLAQLPHYLVSSAPLDQKIDFLSRVAVFWFSADGPYGFPEWGFAVDAMDLVRFLAMSLLVGAYFALVLHRREQGRLAGWRA